MKILITGDQNYSNRIKIRTILSKAYKSNTIATFNKQFGTDVIVQQQLAQLQTTIYYFKLYCQVYNMNCLQPKYKFNKSFHPILYTQRNTDALT